MDTQKDKKKSGSTSRRSATRSSSASRGKKRGNFTRAGERRKLSLADLPLKNYQVTGVKWLLQNPFAGIFLDPGLGKTLIVLLAFHLLKKAGYVDWLLVVAPKNPLHQVWPEEVKKWGFEFKVGMLHGPKKDDAIKDKADIYLVSYDGLEWLHERMELLTTRGTGMLVCDESTKIKHLRSKRHQFLDAIVQCFGRRAILTGTPIPNGYDDLFGQIKVLDLGKRLGRFRSDYRTRFMTQLSESYMSRKFVPKNKEAVKKIEEAIRDICLRFSDRDLGLKKWNSHTIKVQLPLTAREVYTRLEVGMVAKLIEGTVQANNPGVLTSKLRQVASGGVYIENELRVVKSIKQLHDAKTDAVEDLIDELGDKPLMVVYEFEHDLQRLRARFGDIPAIKGKVSVKKGLEIMRSFNEGKVPLLAAQESAVALGLNLQKACSNICWYTITWNLENYIQAIKRVHRQGQKNNVHVYHIVADDTVDERVMSVIQGKNKTQRALLDALRAYHIGLNRGVQDYDLPGRPHTDLRRRSGAKAGKKVSSHRRCVPRKGGRRRAV